MSSDKDSVQNKGDASFLGSLGQRQQEAEESKQPAESAQAAEVKSAPEAKRPAARKGKAQQAKAASAAPEPAPAEVAESAPAVAPPTHEVPGVVTFGGKQFVEEDGDLLPVNAPIKMSVTMTALERQRLRIYAQERNLALVDVFREFLAPVLSGEGE